MRKTELENHKNYFDYSGFTDSAKIFESYTQMTLSPLPWIGMKIFLIAMEKNEIFEKKCTQNVVEKLVEKFDVNPFILTARYAGTHLDELEDAACEKFKLEVSAMAHRMYSALPILERSSVLRTGGKIRHFRMADENGTNTVMFKDGIIFAGSHTQTRSIKGKFLARFMERSF